MPLTAQDKQTGPWPGSRAGISVWGGCCENLAAEEGFPRGGGVGGRDQLLRGQSPLPTTGSEESLHPPGHQPLLCGRGRDQHLRTEGAFVLSAGPVGARASQPRSPTADCVPCLPTGTSSASESLRVVSSCSLLKDT